MKAIRIHAYGGSEVMRLEDAPTPELRATDVLIRVVAAGVNPVDWKIRAGALAQRLPKSFPFTLGQDASGIVAAVGRAVGGLEVGDDVFCFAEFARGGTYAEYVAVDVAQVARKPRTISFATAAALPTPGQAAWTAVVEAARVERGMRVLIHGGAGAVGSIAVQLATRRGAHVVTTVAGEDVAEVKSLGADEVIDYEKQKFEVIVRGVDVVIDLLGGPTQEASWEALSTGGLLVSTVMPPSAERAAALGARAEFVFTQPRASVLAQLAALVDRGELRVLLRRELALADAPLAHDLGERGTRGKTVLHVAAPTLDAVDVTKSEE